ncbi:MAG: DUF494 family protein, partial [Neisseria elongata]
DAVYQPLLEEGIPRIVTDYPTAELVKTAANSFLATKISFINALMFMPAEDITVDMAKVMSLLVLWAQKSELPVLVGDDLMAALHGEATMH